ncbi:hypothetical protein P9112_002321 [Eukaryota sp. TZLM1-RC]
MSTFRLQFFEDVPSTNPVTIMNAFQSSDVDRRIEAMKSLLHIAQFSPSETTQLVMPWIRYILPDSNKMLKRLSYLFLESILNSPTFESNSTLVCNHLHADLSHANEFVRGLALRLVARINRRDLLPSLIPAVLDNLTSRYTYVRRNAVVTVHHICKKFPDAIDISSTLMPSIEEDQDPTVLRNTFACLADIAPGVIHDFITPRLEQLTQVDPAIQLVIVRIIASLLTRRQSPSSRAQWLRALSAFLDSHDTAVLLECSDAVLTASSATHVIKKATECYATVLHTNRIGASAVLERLKVLAHHKPFSIDYIASDLTKIVVSKDLSISPKLRDAALDLVKSRLGSGLCGPLVKVLKSEFGEVKDDKGNEMPLRYLVIALKSLADSCPSVTGDVLSILMDSFLTLSTSPLASSVLLVVKDLLLSNKGESEVIINEFVTSLPTLKGSRSIRVVLWLIGELTTKEKSLPVAQSVISALNFEESELFNLINNTSSFVSTIVALCLIKLLNKCKDEPDTQKFENLRLLVADYILRQLKLRNQQKNIYTSRLLDCLACVFDLELMEEKIGDTWKSALDAHQRSAKVKKEGFIDRPKISIGSVPSFSAFTINESQPLPLSKLVSESSREQLNIADESLQIVDLTGLDSPVIVEAYIRTHSFMVYFDVFVRNKSDHNLSNILLNIEATGDLKISNRPGTFSLETGKSKLIPIQFTVGSLETSAIFGHIELNEGQYIPLADVRLDIVSFIHPHKLGDLEFKQKWSVFEWENKLNVSSKYKNLKEFVETVTRVTNLVPLVDISEWSDVLLCLNLSGRSVFGDDALMNLSIEKVGDDVVGSARIRTKVQGVALALGESVSRL